MDRSPRRPARPAAAPLALHASLLVLASSALACNAIVGIEDVLPGGVGGGGDGGAATTGATTTTTTAAATGTGGDGATSAGGGGATSSAGGGGAGGDGGGTTTSTSSVGGGGGAGGEGGAATTGSTSSTGAGGGDGGGGEGGGVLVDPCGRLDGLVAWWVASDATTGDAGTPVEQWVDRVADRQLRALDAATAPVVAADAMSGHVPIHFDQSSVPVGDPPIRLQTTLSGAVLGADARFSLVAVVRPRAHRPGAVMLHWGESSFNGPSIRLGLSENNSYRVSVAHEPGSGEAYTADLEETAILDEPTLVVGMRAPFRDRSTMHVFRDGFSTTPDGTEDPFGALALTNNESAFVVGAAPGGGGFDVEIAEIRVYDHALPFDANTALSACLATEYGLAVDTAQPHCADGVLDPHESGLGCGGFECPSCGTRELGDSCTTGADCRSNLCEELGGQNRCVAVPRGRIEAVAPLPAYPMVAYYDPNVQRVRALADELGVGAGIFEYIPGVGWTSNALGGDVTLPAPRNDAGVAHDPVTHHAWLFGGQDRSTDGLLNDLWHFDPGVGWVLASTSAPPTPRHGAALAFHPAGNAGNPALILHGGFDGAVRTETWRVAPGGGGWSQLGAGGASAPGARAFAPMVHDRRSGRAILVGGQRADASIDPATRGWTGSWADLGAAAVPTDRVRHVSVADSLRGHLVLMGGIQTGGVGRRDVWEWNGTRWIRTLVADGPDDLGGVAVYDPVRRRVVYVGQSAAGATGYPTYEYFTVGTPCATNDQCGSGACVDQVCCSSAACGGGERCNTDAAPGECAMP